MASQNDAFNFDAEDLSVRFKWPEYVVFVSMLVVSAGIGVFYGCFGSKQKTTSEFLMANRSMGTFPMCMSLIASFMSAITLLGTPVEMYRFGTQYWVIGISYFIVMPATAYLFLPVFFNLQLTSAYEVIFVACHPRVSIILNFEFPRKLAVQASLYLQLRFHKSVRLLASSIFTFQMSIYMAIVVYAPALALSQVTGMNVYGAVAAIFVVCIFYTALGGMKAVMWTDTFQVIIMFGSMLIVIIKGAIDVGGASVVWQTAVDGSRIEFFNVNFDPRTRHTIWGLIIGGYFTWISVYGANQAQVQRYMTVPTIKQAQRAIWFNGVGLFTLLTICCFGGLVIFAKYSNCDPLAVKRIKTSDQLFPLFVMDTLGEIPGLPGLFVAGVFSGALSTVSSGLNSLAAICLEDFVKGVFYPNLTESQATKISKCLSITFGLISFALVFVAEQLGGVLQAALSIFGMTGGPLMGVFTLGIFFPWANTKGALVGTLSALTFIFWLGIGANIETQRGNLVVPKLPVSVSSCPVNVTIPPSTLGSHGGILEFYRVSYTWYAAIGGTLTIVIGLVVSFLTKAQDPQELNPELISPPIDRLVCWLFPDFRHKIGWNLGGRIKSTKKQEISNGCENINLNRRHYTKSNRNGIENRGFENTPPETVF